MTSIHYRNRAWTPLGLAYLVASLPPNQQGAASRRLLTAMKTNLSQHERGRLGVSPLDWMAATRHAALPFDRDDIDTLFAAAALRSEITGSYIVRNEDSPLGLGYVHLGAARYVSTLADMAKDSPILLKEVLSPGDRDVAARYARELLRTPPAIELEDDSQTLYALRLPEHQMRLLGHELRRPANAAIRLHLFERTQVSRRSPAPPIRCRSTVQMVLRALAPDRFAIEGATPEWLLECHAGAMDFLWAGIEGHGFSLVARLPDPSGTDGRHEAAGFHFPRGLEEALRLPAEWKAPIDESIAMELAADYPWFACERMSDWVQAIQSRKPEGAARAKERKHEAYAS